MEIGGGETREEAPKKNKGSGTSSPSPDLELELELEGSLFIQKS